LVDDATAKSATVVCCGATAGDHGYFYAPTLLTGVSADALMMREDIFGPVAPIATFATEAEAIARANDTEYSLVAYVFTRDLSRTLLGDLGQSLTGESALPPPIRDRGNPNGCGDLGVGHTVGGQRSLPQPVTSATGVASTAHQLLVVVGYRGGYRTTSRRSGSPRRPDSGWP